MCAALLDKPAVAHADEIVAGVPNSNLSSFNFGKLSQHGPHYRQSRATQAGSASRFGVGQQVHQLPDARRQEEPAQAVFYDALDIIKKRLPEVEPIDVFTQAVENVKPAIEVRSKRVGGAAYQVPMQVNRQRQQSLAIRWILMAVREKKGRATHEKLAEELAAAYKKEGVAMARRENVHRMADANKAFAHFAW